MFYYVWVLRAQISVKEKQKMKKVMSILVISL